MESPPPQSYLNHRRKTLPIVMPDDSDPLQGDQTTDDQKRPDIQAAYPPSSPPTAEANHISSFTARPSVGLDVPGAVQTREPPGNTVSLHNHRIFFFPGNL